MYMKRSSFFKPKYGNKKTIIDGKAFSSGCEADVYSMLLLREKAGEITDIKCQDTFHFTHKNRWRIDFSYIFIETGEKFRVEAKGFETEVYVFKKNLYRYQGDCTLEIWKKRGQNVYLDEVIIPNNLQKSSS